MTGTDTPADRSPLRRLGRLGRNLRNPFALGYLVLCGGLVVWALAVSVADDSGESMAGVVPLLTTAPASLVFLVLPDGAAMLVVAMVVGALVNASVIGWCARALGRGGRPDPTP
ncbi:SCO4225 family membrane protein [Streptomyces sp. NPDC088350]|uniref:SCO4225 family membrane protein n=1 Tax=Streptomyces sp. NPDC088350 TaxID=3365854 RepID=UPI0037FA3065